jgi:aryl-alcohol dehydrogenase-like predicted oxidoreductase
MSIEIGCLRLKAPLGVGTMNWGDNALDKWMNGSIISDEELKEIATLCVASNVHFFDSAEGYAFGRSEVRTATMMNQEDLVIATKFMPVLWRWTRESFFRSLENSRQRLNVSAIDLYFIHTPVHPHFLKWVEYACEARASGLIKEIGLSNCGADQVLAALQVANRMNQKIAANQVLFSLLDYNSPSLQKMLGKSTFI